MLDPATAAPDESAAAVRRLGERDEFGPLGARAGGLFSAPCVPLVLLEGRDELGRRLAAWAPDGDLL